MVKKFLSTAIAMIAISSAANASVLFSSDNTQNSMAGNACYPDWSRRPQTMDMALKSLEQTKEYGVWKNDLMPLKQSNTNEMAGLNPTDLQKVYWQNVQHWSDPTIHSKQQRKTKKG